MDFSIYESKIALGNLFIYKCQSLYALANFSSFSGEIFIINIHCQSVSYHIY